MIRRAIIIADEGQPYVESMQQYISAGGFEVMLGDSGVDGFNKVREELPDIVFIDIQLSGFDGYQICSLLKFDIKYEHIPIVLLTDNDTERDRELIKDCKADGYIVKPVDLNELTEHIMRLVTDLEDV